MTDLIQAITTFFRTIFLAYRRAPWSFITVLLLCTSTYLLVDSNSILNKMLAPVSVEQERFKRVITLNEEIPNRMEELRVRLNSDRVLIRQFHNGKQGISGIPFTFVQTTYAVAAPGKGLTDQEAWNSYPISTMSTTLNMLFTYEKGHLAPKCVHLSTKDVPDDMFKAYLKRYDVDHIMKCPLIDKEGRVVGLIATGWIDKKDESDLKMKQYETDMSTTGQIIVNKLEEIEGKKSWWKFWA